MIFTNLSPNEFDWVKVQEHTLGSDKQRGTFQFYKIFVSVELSIASVAGK